MSRLRDHVVLVEEGASVGTGFLVAPGLVLTCAHVSGAEVGAKVTVRWAGHAHDAVVLAASPAPTVGRLWPYPDLAVLELTDPPEHPCVWLDGRLPERRADLELAGFSAVYEAAPAGLDTDARFGGTQDYHGGEMLQITGAEITPGMSGGPALNTATGGVCGIVKATRMKETALGGLATPVRGLRLLDPQVYARLWRAHDRHHARAPHPAGDPVLASGLRRSEEIGLRGLLTAAHPPDLTPGYLRAAGRLARDPRHPLLVPGDVLNDLGELMHPPGGLLPTLAYAADLCGARGALRDWVFATAGRLDVGAAVAARLDRSGVLDAASVMVCLRPAGNDHTRYQIRVWRFVAVDDVTEVPGPGAALTAEDAWAWLRAHLPAQLAILAGRAENVMVELILPVELMDTAAEDWRVWPKAAWARLGTRHPVLLRDLERFEEPHHPGWQRRWRRLLQEGLDQALALVACDDARDHEQMDAWIEQGLLALVLPGPVGSAPARTAMEAGLFAGIPLILWRRTACGPDACTVAEFHAALTAGLAGHGVVDVPERVRALRNAAAAAPGDARHHGADLAVLWDDPGRRPGGNLMRNVQ
ncbi:VMAP-C domain-containing protein [Longispora urticae]